MPKPLPKDDIALMAKLMEWQRPNIVKRLRDILDEAKPVGGGADYVWRDGVIYDLKTGLPAEDPDA